MKGDVKDADVLTAENVQKLMQDLLDASNELMTEFISKKRAARWDIINDALYRAERTNAVLSERLKLVGKTPSPSRSKP
jgi:hypothetical protein